MKNIVVLSGSCRVNSVQRCRELQQWKFFLFIFVTIEKEMIKERASIALCICLTSKYTSIHRKNEKEKKNEVIEFKKKKKKK